MEEIWKVYKETDHPKRGHRTYEVSNFGRVKINGVITEPHTYYRGYKVIGSFYVHRAVAELFIPKLYSKPCVDHIDTNKANNHVDNLRWCTQKENLNNPLTIQHYSDAKKGKPSHMKGIPRSEETKRKISEAWDKRRKQKKLSA